MEHLPEYDALTKALIAQAAEPGRDELQRDVIECCRSVTRLLRDKYHWPINTVTTVLARACLETGNEQCDAVVEAATSEYFGDL